MERQKRTHTFVPIEADTLQLPFADNTFDVVSVGFGIRNVADLEGGIREMTRVATTGGRIVNPGSSVNRQPLYFVGFTPSTSNTFYPGSGIFISKNRDDAYGYLPRSVMQFPDLRPAQRDYVFITGLRMSNTIEKHSASSPSTSAKKNNRRVSLVFFCSSLRLYNPCAFALN